MTMTDFPLVVALVATVVLATLGKRWMPLARDSYENAWVVLGAGGLAILSALIPNPWVAMMALSLAAHPLVVYLGVRSGLLVRAATVTVGPGKVESRQVNVAAPVEVRIEQQLIVLAGLGLYALLVGRVHAMNMPYFALGILGWAVANVGALIAMEQGWRSPLQCPEWAHNVGWCGMGPSLAWLLALGSLSGVYLAVLWSPWWLLALAPCMYGLFRTQNYSAPASVLCGLAVFAWCVWPETRRLAPTVAIAPIALAWIAIRRKDSHTARWGNIRRLWDMILLTKGLGAGLGFVRNAERRQIPGWPHPEHAYTCAHCDWLQSVIEVGPMPLVAALGYLATTAWWLPATPFHAYAFGLVAATAVYALVYFPLRVPWQALVLLIAMAAVEAR